MCYPILSSTCSLIYGEKLDRKGECDENGTKREKGMGTEKDTCIHKEQVCAQMLSEVIQGQSGGFLCGIR